ncbi:MAG TPA: hypothetical protein VMB26_18195 [Candidatus Binataceae bacterium]|nr:hypothetical protein [Candidatus Binataceae bacterium]
MLALVALVVIVAAGCQHRVVAVGSDHTVKLYPDEATYEKVKGMKKEGGPMAMLGGMGESFVVKELDNNTPIRIISTDSEGAQVEVTDGPNKGAQGFVAAANVS